MERPPAAFHWLSIRIVRAPKRARPGWRLTAGRGQYRHLEGAAWLASYRGRGQCGQL